MQSASSSGSSMSALVIGAGRMGLTHIALFNLLTDFRIRWTVVEPSRVVRLGMRRVLSKQMLAACDDRVRESWRNFDFALITSPTNSHASAYAEVADKAAKVFVEKPLAVSSPSSRTLCGYVLLHHPLHQTMKQALGARPAASIRVELRANTVLTPSAAWRNLLSRGGGVINEFGSHAFSLLVDLAGAVANVAVDSAKVVHSVDAPDMAVISGRTTAGIDFEISLDWSDPTVRKPTYTVQAECMDGTRLRNDFYEFDEGGRRTSIADTESDCGAYLRGIEFTNQARYFLDNDEFPAQLSVAEEVDRVLGELRDRTRG